MDDGVPEPDFARVFDEAPVPFLLLTPDLVIVHANRARLEATATTLEDTVGRGLFEVFPLNPDDPSADGVRNLRSSLERVRDTGRPHTMAIQKYDIPMPDGTYEERFWSPRNVPILDDDGRVAFLLHRSDDITDYIRDRDAARREAARGVRWRERAEQVEGDLFERARELEALNAELRAANERERRSARLLAGLAATASAMAAAETVEECVAELIRHGQPALGTQVLAVALGEAGGPLTQTDSAGEVQQVPAGSPLPAARAARGHRVLARDRDAVAGLGTEVLARADALGVTACAALPLRAGGEVLGSLTLGWAAVQTFEDDEVALLDGFAAQCAQAVDRIARLEAERRRATATATLAETLQRSLLTDPPQPDRLQIAVRYRPAAQEAQVGGDWYDAFVSPRGDTTLVVGDVTGHDRASAAAMGQIRNLLRGVAHALDRPPAEVLAGLDRALADLGMTTLATAVVATVEPSVPDGAGAVVDAGSRLLRWSNAGHPPPLLVRPDGTAEVLERPADLLLGLLPRYVRHDHAVPLLPGATVVLYTDGLVERRGEALDLGLARMAHAAGDLAHLSVEDFCDALLARLAPDPDDDIALVALRALPQPAQGQPSPPDPARHTRTAPGWDVAVSTGLPADVSAARLARAALAQALSSPALAQVDGDTAELLTSELATNAVRHGCGRLGLRVLVRPGRLRVELHDGGEALPVLRDERLPDEEAEGGRGLWLVDALATRWGTEARAGGGKDVWFELR